MKWNTNLYNSNHSFVYKFGEDLINLLDPQSDERILDVGCGSGQLTSKINELVKEVIGIDKSEEMIKDATMKFPEINFKVADASNFNFETKFDAVFSNATLHWILTPKKVLKSIYCNLKENGRFIAEFGGKGNIHTIEHQVRKSLKKRGYEKQSELKQWYFPSIGEYTTLLESEGFKVKMAQHFDRPTELKKSESGIKDWLSMFGMNFFKDVSEEDIEDIKREVQNEIKDICYTDGKWYADYKRIRIVAIKKE